MHICICIYVTWVEYQRNKKFKKSSRPEGFKDGQNEHQLENSPPLVSDIVSFARRVFGDWRGLAIADDDADDYDADADDADDDD